MALLAHFLWILFLILAVPLTLMILSAVHFFIMQRYMVYGPGQPFVMRTTARDIEHEEIYYLTRDGCKINAWYVPCETSTEQADKKDNPVILFCHGNVGNVSQRIDTFHIFKRLGLDVFIFDYRGYGRSQGRPSEKGTYLDGEGAWQYLTIERNIDPGNIILFGRSLGGAIASYLAEKYKPGGLVIESSFTSIPDMARFRFPRWAFNRLVRYSYNTLRRMKHISCPVLIIHSPEDEVIPYKQGQRLFEAAQSPKTFLKIKGKHYHGFLDSGERYVDGLRDYFSSLYST